MDYDIIVVGGGHAGIEAALACARLSLKTILLTQNIDTIGKMSCNPAIGGLAKGNIVREIDALGGQMAKLIDASMLQFRILNRKKGPSVQAPRAQADKLLYQSLAKEALETQNNLSLFQDEAIYVLKEKNKARGVLTSRGNKIYSKKVIITTGTFLNGKIHIGKWSAKYGRLEEPSSTGLDNFFKEIGHEIIRLKTGTSARIKKDSVDFSKLEEQFADKDVIPQFSFEKNKILRPSLSCYITYTNEKTHKIIRENIKDSPSYSGTILGIAPRYCPSIEDKVIKFPQKEKHQIFLEPEGEKSGEIYLNGIASSMAENVQRDFIQSISGLENAIITRPGYAVEYDCVDPLGLFASLESKFLSGLYIAGQTNGTSGYEEAAAQGIMAGINASLSLLEPKKNLILSRSESYIGVLIDDLVTLGTKEPYRMFTSRAEHRINLRHNTAEIRLLEKAREIKLVSEERYKNYLEQQSKIEYVKELLNQRKIKKSDTILQKKLESEKISFEKNIGKSFKAILKNPKIRIQNLLDQEPFIKNDEEVLKEVETQIKYEGYLKREEEHILKFQKIEKIKIPENFDFDKVFGLSNESREKLKKIRPLNVQQANKISGVRKSDIAILMVSLSRKSKGKIENEFLDYSKNS